PVVARLPPRRVRRGHQELAARPASAQPTAAGVRMEGELLVWATRAGPALRTGTHACRAAGDGREDRDRVAFLDVRLEDAQVPDVLAVDVQVHEPMQAALVRDDAVGQTR